MSTFPPSDKSANGMFKDMLQRITFLERRLRGAVVSTFSTIRLTSTSDVTLTSTDHAFQIGDDTVSNLAVDANEIQARNNGAGSALNLNVLGGDVNIGLGSSRVFVASWKQFWHVGQSSASSIPSATWTRITNWTTVYQGGDLTYSAGVFTVGVDGAYTIHAQFRTAAQTTSVGQRTCRLVFGGSTSASVEGMGFAAAANLSGGSQITQQRRLLAGDTVAFEVYQSHGADINTISGAQYTNFSIAMTARY